MTEMGRVFALMGAVLVLAGFIFQVLGRFNLPLGHLPGDLTFRTKRLLVSFPLATSLLLSVALSAVLYLVARFRR